MNDKRFVIHEHKTADGVHWDLMLECDEVLSTFRLEQAPAQVLLEPVRAEKIFGHPLRFLTYEGPVQQGTGRVHLVEGGTYRTIEASEDRLVLDLSGAILKGPFTLIRTGQTEWRLSRESPGQDLHQLPR